LCCATLTRLRHCTEEGEESCDVKLCSSQLFGAVRSAINSKSLTVVDDFVKEEGTLMNSRYVALPVCLGNHWTLLIIENPGAVLNKDGTAADEEWLNDVVQFKRLYTQNMRGVGPVVENGGDVAVREDRHGETLAQAKKKKGLSLWSLDSWHQWTPVTRPLRAQSSGGSAFA